jgi:hypothetical protein
VCLMVPGFASGGIINAPSLVIAWWGVIIFGRNEPLTARELKNPGQDRRVPTTSIYAPVALLCMMGYFDLAGSVKGLVHS